MLICMSMLCARTQSTSSNLGPSFSEVLFSASPAYGQCHLYTEVTGSRNVK